MVSIQRIRLVVTSLKEWREESSDIEGHGK